MTARVDLRLCGTMDHLRLVWQAGETLLDSIAFQEDPEGTRYNILLALQEMVTNILRHAYGGDETRPLEISLGADEDGFEMTLRDQGPEFNPLLIDTSAIQNEAVEQTVPTREGGYGILITKMVMDKMEYERRQGWNVLRMRKSCAVPAASLAGLG